jgi:hypothetical protein
MDLDFLECEIPLTIPERNLIMELCWKEAQTTDRLERKEKLLALHDKIFNGDIL